MNLKLTTTKNEEVRINSNKLGPMETSSAPETVQKLHIVHTTIPGKIKAFLGGGWTTPSQKYARQIGSFPQVRVKYNILKTTT